VELAISDGLIFEIDRDIVRLGPGQFLNRVGEGVGRIFPNGLELLQRAHSRPNEGDFIADLLEESHIRPPSRALPYVKPPLFGYACRGGKTSRKGRENLPIHRSRLRVRPVVKRHYRPSSGNSP